MNHLAHETSPYLLQHAANPVDWYPWGQTALDRAKHDNKPILLSIGYSACHWCHVMAHESFEDARTAAVMNDSFVNIKVDREERPDLDRIYQIAHQMLAQRGGGWPLTLFLTPDDRHPFFSGTYFPKEQRQGLPAFTDILGRVATYYREHQDDIREQNKALANAFADLNPPASPNATLTTEPLQKIRVLLDDEFDDRFGGFGDAPKFPHPATLDRLLRHWQATAQAPQPDLKALYMATLTLQRMAEGGLFDQLGGGFYRYSVDAYWMIPHFEKMLYDNALLLPVYAQAALATGESFFARIANDTARWMIDEMQSKDGGFYSSLDADSEGHEGKFYVWDRDEAQALLTPEEYAVAEHRYGLARVPNFEGTAHHLHAFESLEKIGEAQQRSAMAIGTVLDAANRKLLAARVLRARPARDEKILASWNALAIRGMAIAGRALRNPDFTRSAECALAIVRRDLWRSGRLLATVKDGRAHLNAYLDDYAFLADAMLELLQNRWRTEDLAFTVELVEVLLKHFVDRDAGGFYFTSDDHETLVHRSKSFGDDATPSGNAVAVRALLKLGTLLGESRYLRAAEMTLKAGWAAMQRYPQGHATLLTALDDHLRLPEIVVIRGVNDEGEKWREELSALYAPQRMTFSIPVEIDDLPLGLSGKSIVGDKTTAYLCRGSTCQAPVYSLADLVSQIGHSAR